MELIKLHFIWLWPYSLYCAGQFCLFLDDNYRTVLRLLKSVEISIVSRLNRNVVTVSHTCYSLFLTFLTDSEVLVSALLPQFLLRYDRISILRPPKVLLRKVERYRKHHCWMLNLLCIPLRPQWRLSRKNTCLKVFLSISERFSGILGSKSRVFQTAVVRLCHFDVISISGK